MRIGVLSPPYGDAIRQAYLEWAKRDDDERLSLEQLLEALDSPPVIFDNEMEQRLTACVAEWRDILGRQVPQARQILNKLLAEKITFTPEDRDGRRGFRFRATGTVEKLVEGIVPGSLRAVVSPTGLVDLYQMEIRGEMRLAA